MYANVNEKSVWNPTDKQTWHDENRAIRKYNKNTNKNIFYFSFYTQLFIDIIYILYILNTCTKFSLIIRHILFIIISMCNLEQFYAPSHVSRNDIITVQYEIDVLITLKKE